MDLKRLTLAVAVIFIFALIWNSVVHLVLLQEANLALEGIARPAAERNMALGMLLIAGIALLFVYSYAACARSGGLKGGLLHGLWFGLLAGLLVDLNQFLIYPLPATLALGWFLFGLVEFCIYGLLTALLYPIKPQRA